MIMLTGEIERRIISAIITAQVKQRNLGIIAIDLQIEIMLERQLNAVLERKLPDLRGRIGLRQYDGASAHPHQQNSQNSHRSPEIEATVWFRQTNPDNSWILAMNNY